jgi:peptidoglycan/LPS O-acetylase OafA/YrhL
LHGAAGATIRLVPTFVASVLMLQSWHPYLLGEWNRPSWSLSAEAFFYFLFPVLSMHLAWPKENAWTRAVFKDSGLLVLGCLVMGFASYASVQYPQAAFYLEFNPVLLATLFVMGIVLYRIEQLIRRLGPDASDILNVVCFVLVLAGVADFILNYTLSPGIRAAASCLSFVGLIVLGRGGPSSLVRPLSWPFMLLLGEASYAVYLLQFPLLFYFQKVWNLLGLERLDAPGSKENFYILYTFALIGTAIFVFKFVETPARRYLQKCQPWSLRPLQEPVRVFSGGHEDREKSVECFPGSSGQSSRPLPSGPE